jgi:hypothetical protein
VNYDDETLMAYADGELDEAQRAAIAAAVARDPLLARRVEQHRALRAEVAGAFAGVLDQPVPERLQIAARGAEPPAAKPAPPRAEVVPFPARPVPAGRTPWRAREWGAMAASVFLGVLVSWQLLAPEESVMSPGHGALVARGELATALERQLASTQRDVGRVSIGLTFRSREGQFCRSFVLTGSGTAGLACRVDGEWLIPMTIAAPLQEGGVRQAAAPPAPLVREIEARISGEPLDAAAERQAQANGWNAAGP